MNYLVRLFLASFSASRNRAKRGRRLQELLLLIGVLWMLFFTSLVLRTAQQETTTTTAARRRRRQQQPHLQDQQGNPLSTAATRTATFASLAKTTPQKSILEPQQRIIHSSSHTVVSKTAKGTSAASAEKSTLLETKSPSPPTPPLACQTPPGQSRVEGGNPMGYQVLRRLQYFLQQDPYAAAYSSSSSSSTFSNNTNKDYNNNNTTTIILCILPFFSMAEQRVALETYGQDCDKVLLITDSAFTADLPDTTSNLYRLQVNQKSSSSSHTIMTSLMEKLSSIEYDWIHWASPDRYLVVLSLRSFLNTPPLSKSSTSTSSTSLSVNNNTYINQQQDDDDAPRMLESWDMTNPSLSKYQSLFGGKQQQQQNNKVNQNQQKQGCLVPKTWNRAATTRLLSKCLLLKDDDDILVKAATTAHSAAANNLTEWIATCFHDVMNITCSEVVIQPQAMKYSSYGPNNYNYNNAGTAGTTTVTNQQQQEQNQQQQQQHWLHLKRYFEIHASRPTYSSLSSIGMNGGDGDSDHHRLHAILHGFCDPFWDGKLTTTTTAKVERPDYHVHDPTYVRNHPLPFTYHPEHDKLGVCEYKLGQGDEGPNGIRGLEKIRLMETPPNQQRKKILCMVYTHSGRHDQILSIAETWGPRCDGFMAASNQTNVTIGAVHIPHEGPEQYSNMWLKVRAMWQYAYHYLNDFDFFHMGGDDHYVIAENLRFVVSTGNWKGPWNQSSPLYLGGSLPLFKKRRYCNGGSGYTLNRAALRLLVEELLHTPRCWPHWQGSDEDRIIASCFRQVHGLQCMDTNDEMNETRYHTWNVDQHVAWKAGIPGQDWESLVNEHGIAWKEGIGQVSESSVAFHLKQPRTTPQASDSGMRRYHAILYGLCRNHSH